MVMKEQNLDQQANLGHSFQEEIQVQELEQE